MTPLLFPCPISNALKHLGHWIPVGDRSVFALPSASDSLYNRLPSATLEWGRRRSASFSKCVSLMPSASTASLVLRLFALTRRYHWGCARLILLQLLILGLGLTGLALFGLAFDTIRASAGTAEVQPQWPWGLKPPAGLTPWQLVVLLAVGVFLAAALRAVLNYRYAVASAQLLQQQIVVELRAEVYEKLQRLGPHFYGKSLTGSLISRVTSDVQSLRLFIDGVILQMAIVGLSLIFCLVYMFRIDAGLTLVCLATTPILGLMGARFSKAVRPQYVRNRELFDHLLLVLTENVLGVQVVKGLSRQDAEVIKFADANRAVRAHKETIFHRVSLFSPSVELLMAINQTALLGYGGYLVIQGRLPLGTGLLVFSGLLQQFSGQVTKVTNIINSIQESLAAAKRTFELFDAPIEIQNRPCPRRLGRARGRIEFQDVSYAHVPGHPVLDGVNLSIEPGECVAFFGTTGVGKTTLLNLVLRFYDVSGGRVLIDGVDVRDLDLADLRRNVGIVFQEPFLFSDTVAANIAFSRADASPDAIRRAAAVAAAEEFIEGLPKGYDTLLRENGKDLSGGQRQRLVLARAVLQDPPILLLDDPTSAVDATTEQEILAAIRSSSAGRTTLLVAHRMSTLQFADRIVVLQDGRIVEVGSHAQLLARGGVYWQTVQLQSEPNERTSLRSAA